MNKYVSKYGSNHRGTPVQPPSTHSIVFFTGNDRYSTEINCTEFTFLSNKNDNPVVSENNTSQEKVVAKQEVTDSSDESDDLPF